MVIARISLFYPCNPSVKDSATIKIRKRADIFDLFFQFVYFLRRENCIVSRFDYVALVNVCFDLHVVNLSGTKDNVKFIFQKKNKGAGFEPASLADTQGAFSNCRLLWLFTIYAKRARLSRIIS